MFGEGIRPPVKYYSIVPPSLVSGAEVTGNRSDVVTEEGKTFLSTVLNLVHSSVKLFGNDEVIPFDTSIWPGLTLKTHQDDWQFIEYIGKDGHKISWGDLSLVDMDFDRVKDTDRTIDDGVPYYLYVGVDDAAQVDTDAIWAQVRGKLSHDDSFWQTILKSSYPTTNEGCFAYLLGLNQMKRDWIYGMNALGINPLDPNANGTIDRMNSIFDSWKMQEAGALNIQGLQNYIGLRLVIQDRFSQLMNNTTVNGAMLTAAKSYFADRAGSTAAANALNAFNVQIGFLTAKISELQGMLDVNNKVRMPARGGVKETEAQYQKKCQAALTAASDCLDEIKALLASLNYGEVNSQFGMVTGGLKDLEQQLVSKINDYVNSIPVVGRDTDFTGIKAKLGGISTVLAGMSDGYLDIKNAPELLVQALFDELKTPLSSAELNAEVKGAVKANFNAALSKPVGFVSSIQATNGMFRSLNRRNSNDYSRKIEDYYSNKMDEARAEAKHEAKRKEEAKKAERGDINRAQEQRRADAKRADEKKVQPKKKGA